MTALPPFLPILEVTADRVTGEWLHREQTESLTHWLDWAKKKDDDTVHYDFAEIDEQMVAVVVRWVD